MLISAPKVTVRLSGYQSAPQIFSWRLPCSRRISSQSAWYSPPPDDHSLRDVHRQLDVAALRLKHVLDLVTRWELAEQMESHMPRACPLRRS
jgi:hypothetical protein